MNTLSRAVTARYFAARTEYQTLRRHWSALVNSDRRHQLTAAHHLLYLALLGKDWRKAFSFPSNLRKLANGAFADWGFFSALRWLHSQTYESMLLEPFDGLVTVELLCQVQQFIPWSLAFKYKEADYGLGRFPFDAYTAPEPTAEKNHA